MPKLGNEDTGTEDAYSADEATMKFAISDGATESIFALEWATALVSEFTQAKTSATELKELEAETFQDFFSKARETWLSKIQKNLPYYAEDKLRDEGSYATFLGVEFKQKDLDPSNGYLFEAIGVGDSCLFQIRGSEKVLSFPITVASEFSSITSFFTTNQGILQSDLKFVAQDVLPGDYVILASDALSKWILSAYEDNVDPSKILFSLTEENYKSFFEQEIYKHRLKNDDITLLLLQFT
jgi:hypothetical protein